MGGSLRDGSARPIRQGVAMRPVLGYIDPGAGSLVIQAIIAAIVSIPFFFRNAIRNTIGRFRRGSQAPEEKGTTPTDPE
jgi:hypothetical protein